MYFPMSLMDRPINMKLNAKSVFRLMLLTYPEVVGMKKKKLFYLSLLHYPMIDTIIIIIIITIIYKILFLLPFELSLQCFKAPFRIKVSHRYFSLLNSLIYKNIS